MRYADIRIETERLLLRSFAMKDAQEWFQIMSSPEVTRYWSHLPWQNIQQAKEDIIQDITHMERKEYLRLAIIDKATDSLRIYFLYNRTAVRTWGIGCCKEEDVIIL